MDLFSITCTTCKSRLKVREESAIGNILACPKCGGMVMVKPPPGWQKGMPPPPPEPYETPGTTAVVEPRKPADTLSDSNFDAVDDVLAGAPPRPRATVTVAPDAPGLARPRLISKPTEGNGASHAPPAEEAPPPVAAIDPEAEEPVELPLRNERPSRYWLLLAASILAGIALAVTVVAASMYFLRGGKEVVAQTNPPQNNKQADKTHSPTQDKQQVKTDDSSSKPQSEQSNNADPTETVVPVETKNPSSELQENSSEPAPMTEAPSTPEKDPLGIVDPPTPAANNQAAATTNSPLAQFDKILAGDAAAALPEPQDSVAEPMPMPAEGNAASNASPPRPALPRPPPRDIDVAARLTDPLPAIEAEGTPLADFLQVMSDLSTIPITLQPDALPLIRVSPLTPLSLRAENTTVGGALTSALTPLGLEHVVLDGHVIVRAVEASPPPTINYPVKDLTQGDEQAAAELAALLTELVEPASWRAGEENASITVTPESFAIKQRRAVHAQLFFLCEKLRTARKLPPISRFDPALFKLDSRTQLVKAKLNTPITLNYSQPTRLEKILERLGKAADVRILVDWSDIAAAGWNPDAEATLVVDKQSLALSMTALLEPMDLTWRIVDGQTLQVMTPAGLAARNEIELYPVGDLVASDPTGETLLARISGSIPAAIPDGGPLAVRYDEAGQCLIAAVPQPQQQQLEVMLLRMRTK